MISACIEGERRDCRLERLHMCSQEEYLSSYSACDPGWEIRIDKLSQVSSGFLSQVTVSQRAKEPSTSTWGQPVLCIEPKALAVMCDSHWNPPGWDLCPPYYR